jgi:hypothetical protein
MITNLNVIVKEWAYRVHDGKPNPNNHAHLYQLSEILIENKWSLSVIDELLQNLSEGDEWWTKLSPEQQAQYIKDHPKSQKAQDAKEKEKGEEPKKDKPKGDQESTQNHIKKGFVKGAAPGNAGSMYNEIMSGEVADLFRDNPDATEEELVKIILDKHGDSNLAKQNSSGKMAGKLSTKELPEDLPKEQRELYSKTLIAVRSGKRKHQRSENASNDLGWKNTETAEYFGDKTGLKKQEEDIKFASKVIDLDGNEIPKDEIVELIRAGGGGDNPSDTATIIKNKDTGEATILFTSDKDSTSAIIAQSSTKAESTQTDDAILSLADNGKLSQGESEQIAGERRIYAENLEKIESKLKSVTNEPAKYLNDNFNEKTLEALINTSAGSNSRKYFDAEKKKFSGESKIPKTDKKYSDFLPEGSDTPPTDEQVALAFLNYSNSGIKDLTTNQQKMIGRANSKIGGVNVDDSVEKIRKESIDLLDKQIEELDEIEVEGVGLGTRIEGSNIWKQGHMDAISGKKGVHKHRGMFETNHAGVVLDGNVLKKTLGVDSKEEFFKKLQVDKSQVQKSKGDRVTGSTGLVYMMVGEEKIPIMEKRLRSKEGPLGKLQTVYRWAPEFEKLIKDNQ